MAAPRRRFRWGFLLLGVVLVGLIVWAWIALTAPPPKHTPPPTPVQVARVTQQDMPVQVTALGAAQAWQSVLINPQINGRVVYVAREGDDVSAGALLVQLDCGPQKAALAQAQGSLKRDESLLAGARIDLARYQTLLAQNSIAKQTVDDEAAVVRQDEGLIAADQGQVTAAAVNVGYCAIRSPVSGRVGVRLVDPGNVVTTALTTGIISVNQIQPIAVIFTVPQGDFQRLSDASNGFQTPLATEALSQETGESLGLGQLAVVDNHVDPQTGTVQLKAKFPNDGRRLWPGQFVNVRMTLQTLPQALTIPATAVNKGPSGLYAYVVGADGKVDQRPITVAATQGGVAVIQSGLRPGETVVTDGQMSLRKGMSVSVAPPPGAGPQGHGGGHSPGAGGAATNAPAGAAPSAPPGNATR